MNTAIQITCTALALVAIGLPTVDAVRFSKQLVGSHQSAIQAQIQQNNHTQQLKYIAMKEWKKIGENKYVFWQGNKEIGIMHIHFNSLSTQADCTIGDENYTIKRIGFWKSAIEVADTNNSAIATVVPEKWFVHSSKLTYKGEEYTVVFRNNPQAEIALKLNNQDILAYGIDAKAEGLKVRISTTENNEEPMLDFLLWYLFAPIVVEYSGDNFTFFMLLLAN